MLQTESQTNAKETKVCFKCTLSLPRSDFYRHAKMADGLLGKCKACTKSDVSIHRYANHEKVKEYDRERTKSQKRLEHLRDNCKKFRFENPEKYKAHSLVSSAIKCGRLSKLPCSICSVTGRGVHAHHDDYSKPLDVIWLCSQHHHNRHKELRALSKDPDNKEVR